MEAETLFIAGAVVGSFTMLIGMPLLVFKPRFEQLVADRDAWKLRAEIAENQIGRAEALDLDVIGGWDQATAMMPDDWLD